MTTINEISNHIMGYFNGTLDAFGYTAQSVNEISNPDESYMGTLNLQFREYPIDDDEKVETYCRESDAFEQYVIEFINSHWDEHHPLKELNPNHHYMSNIMQVFLPTGNYQIMYTLYPQGFISVIAKPHDK